MFRLLASGGKLLRERERKAHSFYGEEESLVML